MSKDEQWLLEEKYNGEKTAGFFTDCKRLQAGEPLGYVIGHIPFLNCTIYLDNQPLIPRPETEFWVERAIAEIKSKGAQKILDLCAGSGCIGVAVAKALPEAQVDFSEIDPHLLSTITKNLQKNLCSRSDLEQRFEILQSDLFCYISEKYDFILSNPPYIDPVLDRTQTSVKDYEPHKALYGGIAGLELIKQIIQNAPAHLTPNGQLWLEHEPEQSAAIEALAVQSGLIATTHTDQYGHQRYSILVLQ